MYLFQISNSICLNFLYVLNITLTIHNFNLAKTFTHISTVNFFFFLINWVKIAQIQTRFGDSILKCGQTIEILRWFIWKFGCLLVSLFTLITSQYCSTQESKISTWPKLSGICLKALDVVFSNLKLYLYQFLILSLISTKESGLKMFRYIICRFDFLLVAFSGFYICAVEIWDIIFASLVVCWYVDWRKFWPTIFCFKIWP